MTDASKLENARVTEAIIGCAYRVYNTLGFGFLESVYERALVIELTKAGLKAETQRRIEVFYEGQVVGDFRADLFVEDCVLVELKSVTALNQAHEVQLVNYLMATGVSVGLLINFGDKRVEIKRKVRTLPFAE